VKLAWRLLVIAFQDPGVADPSKNRRERDDKQSDDTKAENDDEKEIEKSHARSLTIFKSGSSESISGKVICRSSIGAVDSLAGAGKTSVGAMP
jgi:hypothetical protein